MTVAVIDHNMKYNHDNVAELYDMPQIEFMILLQDGIPKDIEVKHFGPDEYDAAKAWQMKYLRYKEGKNSSIDSRKSVADEKSEKNLGGGENNADIRSRKSNTRENGTETTDERNGLVGHSAAHSKSKMGQLRSGVYVPDERRVEQGI